MKPVQPFGPLYRFTRVLRRDNDLSDDLMAGIGTDDNLGFRFRVGGRPDNFRFRIEKKDDKERLVC